MSKNEPKQGSKTTPKYSPMSKKELKTQLDKYTKFINGFIESNGYNPLHFYVDDSVVLTIIAKVHQRKSYFEFFHKIKMSEFKEAALISFWCIKLKPLSIKESVLPTSRGPEFDSVNERLALYNIIVTLRAILHHFDMNDEALNTLPDKYLRELIYTFTYRDISKEALITLVETIAIFLGLDPYA